MANSKETLRGTLENFQTETSVLYQKVIGAAKAYLKDKHCGYSDEEGDYKKVSLSDDGYTDKQMKNVFFITYGGRAKNGSSYTPYQSIAHSASQAIAIINTWKTYGRKNSTDPADRIEVNEVVKKKIQALFRDGFGTYPSGEPRTYMGVRTTGCGAWEIGFCSALADTVEEHNRITNELKEMQEQKRKEARKEYEQRRLAELNEQRRGWYHIELTYTVSLLSNGRFAHRTLSGDIIADSGADAYRKAVKYLEGNPPEVMNYYGQLAMFFDVVEMTSSDFSFTFLGVKTDDGYSVELWNEWKAKGEI